MFVKIRKCINNRDLVTRNLFLVSLSLTDNGNCKSVCWKHVDLRYVYWLPSRWSPHRYLDGMPTKAKMLQDFGNRGIGKIVARFKERISQILNNLQAKARQLELILVYVAI